MDFYSLEGDQFRRGQGCPIYTADIKKRAINQSDRAGVMNHPPNLPPGLITKSLLSGDKHNTHTHTHTQKKGVNANAPPTFTFFHFPFSQLPCSHCTPLFLFLLCFRLTHLVYIMSLLALPSYSR